MIIMKQDGKWESMYKFARIYYKHHRNLEVPQRFKTNDGYTYDEAGKINLGTWVLSRRIDYKKGILSENKRQELEKIGMRFENIRNVMDWEEWYKYASIYYKHYGNLEVPVNFQTNDGYNYDKSGKINLGVWISHERINYKEGKLDKTKIDLLKKIGMRFENIRDTISWDESYKYASIYYNHYGNLKVPIKFKTNNGYIEDKSGKIHLGEWIAFQKNFYKNNKLDSNKIKLLEKIGMVWAEKKYKNIEIPMICVNYNIDIDKNYDVLKNISIQELKIKIEYLKSNKIRLYNNNGILHEIFNMSSKDMKKKYGISLEEMISMYKIKDNRKK